MFARSFVFRLLPVVLAAAAVAGAHPLRAEAAAVAPTRLYPEPPTYLLLRLAGDRVDVHYTPGSLDRAAHLQQRLDLVSRAYERFADQPLEIRVFLLNRREWDEAGIDVPFGVPARAGERGILAPARGDTGTIELWSALLGGRLPNVVGTPVLGTAEEVASMVMADVVVQLLAGEIFVDAAGLASDAPWLRALLAQLASLTVVHRFETDRPEDLAAVWLQLQRVLPPKSFAAVDYRTELGLGDWLAFQGHLHFGARAIWDKAGKDALKKMRELSKKGDGTIASKRLLEKFDGLRTWFDATFSAVSMRR